MGEHFYAIFGKSSTTHDFESVHLNLFANAMNTNNLVLLDLVKEIQAKMDEYIAPYFPQLKNDSSGSQLIMDQFIPSPEHKMEVSKWKKVEEELDSLPINLKGKERAMLIK